MRGVQAPARSTTAGQQTVAAATAPLVAAMTLDVLPYAAPYSATLTAGNQRLGLLIGFLQVPRCPV